MVSYDYAQLPHQQLIDPNNQYPIVTSFPLQQSHYIPMMTYPSNTDTHLLPHALPPLSAQSIITHAGNFEVFVTNKEKEKIYTVDKMCHKNRFLLVYVINQ
jgi:hypothetical protein